jgi:hypothetical protein
MWTSLRNSFLALLALLAATVAGRAAPISDFVFTFSGNYSAGSSTNTQGTGLVVSCFGGGANPPDAGETVRFFVVSGGQVIQSGMSSLSFVTTNSVGPYLGSSDNQSFFFYHAGSNMQLRAVASGGYFEDSGNFNVSTGTANRFLLIGPGMTYRGGRDPSIPYTQFAGTPSVQEPGQPFTVTVLQTDAWFNQVASAGPLVTMSADNLVSFAPTSQSIASNGRADFSSTVNISRSARVITADDGVGGLSPGSLTINTSGPEREQVFPNPSPFNPKADAAMDLDYQLNADGAVKIMIKDQFGQDVWRSEVSGVQGPNKVRWDGRNENGHIVAAGVYYVLLEVNGEITSKKRFGVVK